MPAQVVVVRRSRRSLFAAPRALPDWFRSVWAALFRTALAESETSANAARVSEALVQPTFPVLRRDASGAHRCIGCELCVRVCPTRCLSIETQGEGAALIVSRFDLVRDACIGCSACVTACPEDALSMRTMTGADRSTIAGRPFVSDLLRSGARA